MYDKRNKIEKRKVLKAKENQLDTKAEKPRKVVIRKIATMDQRSV